MKKVLIRADASPRVGYGHLIRSIALGQELSHQGVSVDFISATSDLPLRDYLKTQEFQTHFIRLEENELGSQSDLNLLKERLNPGLDWVVLDNDYFEESYQSEIRASGVNLLVLDDQNKRTFNADLIVNHSIQGKESDYQGHSLAGARYALIRRELINFPKRSKKETSNVLITLGGSPQERAYEKILLGLSEITDRKLNVKLLTGLTKIAVLQNSLKKFTQHKVELLEPSLNPSAVYDWADLVICAAGGSTYELCFFGVVGLVGALAPHQLPAATEFDGRGIFLSTGLFEQESPEKIAETFNSLFSNPTKLQKMRGKASSLVDGRGPRRIFEAMTQVEKETQNA